MNDQKILETIKSTVHAFLPDARILLFGSRARGDHDKFSDFDLLIISKDNFTPREKINWSGKLDKALVKSIHAPVDVLVDSEEEVKIKKELPGHIIQWAVEEGIAI